MATAGPKDVRQHLIERVRYFTGAAVADLSGCHLDRDLRMDPDDFVDFCEELERTFGIELRPFFQDGQPKRRWWFFWTHPVARDVTIQELTTYIEGIISPC